MITKLIDRRERTLFRTEFMKGADFIDSQAIISDCYLNPGAPYVTPRPCDYDSMPSSAELGALRGVASNQLLKVWKVVVYAGHKLANAGAEPGYRLRLAGLQEGGRRHRLGLEIPKAYFTAYFSPYLMAGFKAGLFSFGHSSVVPVLVVARRWGIFGLLCNLVARRRGTRKRLGDINFVPSSMPSSKPTGESRMPGWSRLCRLQALG